MNLSITSLRTVFQKRLPTKQEGSRQCGGLTRLLAEVQVVVVGACQLSHYLSVVDVLGEPAVTGETKRFVQDLILHVDVFQVPSCSGTCE